MSAIIKIYNSPSTLEQNKKNGEFNSIWAWPYLRQHPVADPRARGAPLAGQSVDLVEEHDGRGGGARLSEDEEEEHI